MTETWLRTNTRALGLAMLLPAVLAALAAILWFVLPASTVARVLGGIILTFAVIQAGLFVWQYRRPRLAYRKGELLIYLRWAGPVRVPIRVVEGFLLGQGPSHLPGPAGHRLETSTVVIRLDQRAGEWGRVEVDRALGNWCNHYVTLRGTWCEPLNVEVVNRLNRRLSEVAPRTSGA